MSAITGEDDMPLILEQHSTDLLKLSLQKFGDKSNEEIANYVKELNAFPTYHRPFQKFQSFEMPEKPKVDNLTSKILQNQS